MASLKTQSDARQRPSEAEVIAEATRRHAAAAAAAEDDAEELRPAGNRRVRHSVTISWIIYVWCACVCGRVENGRDEI